LEETTVKPFYWVAFFLLSTGLSIWIAPARSAEGQAAKGRPLYERYCLSCHGPEGRGDGPLGLHLNPPAANFHKPESRNKSDEALLKVIREGHSESAMASWRGELLDEELQDVLAYIRKLSGGPVRKPAG
jgi:mono/diheme cytochrome c family protein